MLQYRPLIEHFSSHGHEVVAFDWLGCGRSEKPRDWYAYDFAELQADLAAVLAKYGGCGSPAMKNAIIAHSAGCALTLGVVATAGASGACSVDAMALLGGIGPGAYRPHPVFYLPVILLNWLQPTLSAGFEALALHEHTRAGTTEAHRAVLALAADVNGTNPMHMCKAYYRQLRSPSPKDVRAAGALVRITLIAGESDQLVPRAQTQALKELLPESTTMHIVPNTSHQMMQEDPAAVGAIIDGFLKEHSGM
jgi:pimeloyl-ACP methyl ester carboxylesterase